MMEVESTRSPSTHHPSSLDLSKIQLTNKSNVITSLAGGAVAGAVAKTVIAPLDRVKINFQIEKRVFTFREGIKFLVYSYQNHGLISLWRGNSATLARVIPSAAINYASHEQFKRLLHVETNEDKKKNPHRSFVAGSLAGVVSTTATYPLDLARARMAVSMSRQYGSLTHVFQLTVREEGLRGLYRGYGATILGVIPYAGTGFFVYETLKRIHFETIGDHDIKATERFICGAIAGLCAQTASYPLDIVRRRMQTRTQYRSIVGTLKHVRSKEGIIGGLYKGLSLNWIKGPVAVGISFTTFDLLTKFLRDLPYFESWRLRTTPLFWKRRTKSLTMFYSRRLYSCTDWYFMPCCCHNRNVDKESHW